ncbi:peptidylprolyl isomerase [Prochlorococcus sp. MIT 1307]|uniref:peptidylprolyl isomerase n=1 Tax=Prochlorococcus sp. MIT 1307 TaxID=3096219 RepID=UPI002A75DF4A|nr:peptidylprolyl isomerase [Prochlorococcus sp. MIT 1307]
MNVNSIFKSLSQETLELVRRGNLVRSLIKEILIYDAINHIHIPPDILKEAINQFYKERQIENINDRKKFLSHHGLKESDLHHQISTPIKIQNLYEDKFGNKAEAHFLRRKENLDQFIYSILRVDNPNLAHELYLQIEGGESTFAALAREYSKDNDRFPDGLVGPRSLIGAHPLIKTAIRASTLGVLQEPFQIENYWLILRLEERRLAKLDSNMKRRMAFELFQIYIEEEIDKALESSKQLIIK